MQANSESPESGTRYVLNASQRKTFAAEGYLKFDGVIPRALLARLSQRITDELEQQQREGRLFSGGGTVSGHLNCFPGAESRFVYDLLQHSGIAEIVRGLSTAGLRAPNIGCNLNLPGSAPQNDHVDGYASRPFLIVNVAAVDTNLDNGAMEILRGYAAVRSEILADLAGSSAARAPVHAAGRCAHSHLDALAPRDAEPKPTSRGRCSHSPGRTAEALAKIPTEIHEGRITFLPNRYSTDLKSRIREQAFVALPALATAYRAVRSLL